MNSESLADWSDKAIWKSFQAGSKSAFEEIYSRYFWRLYLHALKMLGDEDASKDLIQDLFVSLWEKRCESEVPATISAYLFTAVRNRVLNAIEHSRVRSQYISSLARFLTETGDSADEALIYQETAWMIEKEVERFPPKMKEVFILSRHHEFSHKEIADQLHLSDKTVKKQIYNALKILKIRLVSIVLKITFLSSFISEI